MIDTSTLAVWEVGAFTTRKPVLLVKQTLWVSARIVKKRNSSHYSAPKIASIITWYVFLTPTGTNPLT